MLQVVLQHLQKVQYLGLIVYQGQHNDPVSILKLCMFKELI